jgi:glycosyltransferase involved in cell wall biosynthesis
MATGRARDADAASATSMFPMPPSGPTIALCMLVRDDEATVETSLRSALPLISYWVVCDTGSVDRTTEIVTQVLSAIPGELHSRPWRDFGQNRSELMQFARDKADYLLLLDPDMMVTRSHDDLGELADDVYLLRQHEHANLLGAPRLVRGRRQWWFEGSTHEVLVTNGRYSERELDSIIVDGIDRDRGRERALLRRLDVLERDVADGSETPRDVLHLAETLRDLGRTPEAIEWFCRRKELGLPDETAFYANLQEGVLRARDDFFEAVPVLLEAWQRRPTRAEPLYELARGYRLRGDGQLAYHFADTGLKIPHTTDVAFVQSWIYSWGLRFERGWAGGRVGHLEQAREDLGVVLQSDGVPPDVVAVVRDWLENLGGPDALAQREGPAPTPLASLVGGVQVGRLVLEVTPSWPTFNPSVAADRDGLALIVRSLNVVYDNGDLRFADTQPHDINYFVTLDDNLSVVGVDRIDDRPADFTPHPAHTAGFQDLRLIQLADRWFAIGNSWELSPSEVSEAALVELDGATVRKVHRLEGPVPGRTEKNWMPFVHQGVLHCVYSCGPTIIVRIDHQTGSLETASRDDAPPIASSLRGGSQGVPLTTGGYLFVVHETYQDAGVKSYLHRFIRIGSDLHLNAMSAPFTFTGEVREFCAGAAVHGTELVLSFGVRHTESWLAVVPLAGALALLQPVSAERGQELRPPPPNALS